VLLSALLPAACTPKGPDKTALPRPGENHLFQIYILRDQAGGGAWFPLAETAWSTELPARIEQSVVSDDTETERILRDWNARPADVLLLGPGRPAQVWNKLRLPKAVNRLTLTVGEEVFEGAVSVTPDKEGLKKLLKDVCTEKLGKDWQGCRIESKSEGEAFAFLERSAEVGRRPMKVRLGRGDLGSQVPVALEVSIRWPSLVRSLIEKSRKNEVSEGVYRVQAFSGNLEVKLGTQLSGDDSKALNDRRERWLLGELSGNSHK